MEFEQSNLLDARKWYNNSHVFFKTGIVSLPKTNSKPGPKRKTHLPTISIFRCRLLVPGRVIEALKPTFSHLCCRKSDTKLERLDWDMEVGTSQRHGVQKIHRQNLTNDTCI